MGFFEFEWLTRYNKKIEKYWDEHYSAAESCKGSNQECNYEPLDKIQQIELGQKVDRMEKEVDREKQKQIKEGTEPVLISSTSTTTNGTLPKEFKHYGSQETPTRESIQDPKVTIGKSRPTLPKESQKKKVTKKKPDKK